MTRICVYFQVHQPCRLKRYHFFDIGNVYHYEDEELNKKILLKVAEKCYLPANKTLLDLINKYGNDFKIAFSISGIIIEQFKKYKPEVLTSFKRLADTGCVEFINETYYHTLSYLYSRTEFLRQVKLHTDLIKNEFGQTPTTFRNTELIYNNELAKTVELLGFKTILLEGTEKILGNRSGNYVYRPSTCAHLNALMRNYRLSDDIAFRFSNREWSGFPLTADKYAHWVHQFYATDVINLFMDYETFGEHQWEDVGIFAFLRALPGNILKHPNFLFSTPSEVSSSVLPKDTFDCHEYISWADTERDLTAWTGNDLQKDALSSVYALENEVHETCDQALLSTWRKLLISDHFYYMSTKWFNDGDVHKYFNPYDSPYDAFIYYQNVLNDFKIRLKHQGEMNA